MGILHAAVTVGTTATNLLAGVADTFQDPDEVARTLCVQNTSDSTVYLGGPGVTSSAYGFSLAAGQSVSFDLRPKDVLYAVVATGTKVVNTLHLGV